MPIIRELKYRRQDGTTITQDVPSSLNQTKMIGVKPLHYTVFPASASNALPENAISRIKYKNKVAGYAIPGQALLSPENPKNKDGYFAAHSLIAALRVCENSLLGDYSLTSATKEAQNPNSIPFLEGDFYIVLSKETIQSIDCQKLQISLFNNGIYNYRGERPHPEIDEQPPEFFSVHEVNTPSSYIESVFWDLFPYSNDPFLRFFYAYQVVEILIGRDFNSRAESIRQKLNNTTPLNITSLRDLVTEFQDSYKELPRIKQLFSNACGESENSLTDFLDSLHDDTNKKSLAEKLYRVRNILFHEYPRAHGQSEKIELISHTLISYLAKNIFLRPNN